MRALSYKYIQRSAVDDAVAGANSPGEPLAFFLSEPLVTRELKLLRRSVWLVACDEMAALTRSSAPDGVSLRAECDSLASAPHLEASRDTRETAPARESSDPQPEGSTTARLGFQAEKLAATY